MHTCLVYPPVCQLKRAAPHKPAEQKHLNDDNHPAPASKAQQRQHNQSPTSSPVLIIGGQGPDGPALAHAEGEEGKRMVVTAGLVAADVERYLRQLQGSEDGGPATSGGHEAGYDGLASVADKGAAEPSARQGQQTEAVLAAAQPSSASSTLNGAEGIAAKFKGAGTRSMLAALLHVRVGAHTHGRNHACVQRRAHKTG